MAVRAGAGLLLDGFLTGAFATGLRAGGRRVADVRPRDEDPREEVFLSGVVRNTSQESNVVIRRMKIVQERDWERYFFMRKRNWPDYSVQK